MEELLFEHADKMPMAESNVVKIERRMRIMQGVSRWSSIIPGEDSQDGERFSDEAELRTKAGLRANRVKICCAGKIPPVCNARNLFN